MENNGVWVTGGSVQAGAIAAGRNARASGSVHPSSPQTVDELRVQMAAVLEQLRSHSRDLEDSHATLTLAEMAQRELEKETPNKQSLLGTLSAVAAGVGSVATLAGALASLEQAVAVLF
jgi:hypothetical protein